MVADKTITLSPGESEGTESQTDKAVWQTDKAAKDAAHWQIVSYEADYVTD